MLNLFSRTPKHLSSSTYIIEPGMSVEHTKNQNTQGQYSILIDLSNMSNIDALSVQLYIKPGPNSQDLLYLSAEPDHSKESLWQIDVPPCSGFRIKYTLATGKDLKIITHVWEI